MNTEERLIHKITSLGYPAAFGQQIARSLGTEKAMNRMLSYLSHDFKPSMEDIADEMVAICDERDTWVKKKKTEYYNAKYNTYLFEQKKK